MARKRMQVDQICVLCRTANETIPHLFGSCTYAQRVLHDEVLRGHWDDYLEGDFFVNNNISKARRLLAFLFLSVAVYEIWHERNKRIHNAGHDHPATFTRLKVMRMVRDRLASSTWFSKCIRKDPSLLLHMY